MKPQETLLRHEALIKLMLEHEYIPAASQANFNEMLGALREIDPVSKYDPGCSGCMLEIAKMANIHLQEYKKSIPVYYTFPKQ